jgi:hypothetical protein
VLLGDYYLSGNILDSNSQRTDYKYKDTTSSRRGSQGSMMMDFGINCKPNENFKFLAELRFRSVIGFDALSAAGGSNNSNIGLVFRQVRAEGNFKNFYYQIGDIDLGLTKYTLYNNDEIFKTYESSIFRNRRAITQYETFQTANLWRLQGGTLKKRFSFNKVIQNIDFNIFGTRTKRNNGELAIPDRFLVGGKLDVIQSKFLTLGGNWTNFFDLPGTTGYTVTSAKGINTLVSDTAYKYNNQVVSLSYKVSPVSNDNSELSLFGESGISSNSYFIKSLNTTSKKKDHFIDIGLKYLFKPKKIELTASYINVGADFTSPGAQTLRLNTLGRTNLLGSVFNNTAYRVPTIFERHASDFIYNQRIQTGLMVFLPLYGNVLPYGASTPNRSGLVFNFGRLNEPDQVLTANVGGAMLSEIISEGDLIDKKLRKFLQLQGGAALKLSKLIGFKKNITASAGGRYENTNRTGNASVDYKSTLFDAGLTIEVSKDLSFLGGVKYLHGKGREVITQRDVFGGIAGFLPYTSDITQTVLSGGIRVDLFNNSFASVEYNKVVARNNLNVGENYLLGNLFFNFTLRF